MKETCKGYYTSGFDVSSRKYTCDSMIGCGKVHCPVNDNLTDYSATGMGKVMEDVACFKEAHDRKLPDRLEVPDDDRIRLLASLIVEECRETLLSLFDNSEIYHHWSDTQPNEGFSLPVKVDPANLAKELADLVYVTVGMALECGIPLDKVWAEVQRTNMAKIGPDGKFVTREDGKIEKPEGWVGPDIKQALGIE